MRIEDLRRETKADGARAVATILWEDCEREPQEIHYETTGAYAEALSCNPNAFLVGAVLPAIQRGERRIAIDGAICPELRIGVITAIEWFRHWGLLDRPITIEAGPGVQYPHEHPPRAASFLSGGVDSLALLRRNHLDYPCDHPNRIRDCFFVHGFDFGGLAERGPEMASFNLALEAVSAVARDAHVHLIPVFTNVRHLYDDVDFWINKSHGASLASVAHSFAHRLTSASIALDFDIPNLVNAANSPLVEPNFGSAGLRIRSEGMLYSRLDKVRMLSEWPVALNELRVCWANVEGQLNCGQCEKCLRTMLQLLAVGSLEQAGAFASHDVLAEVFDDIHIAAGYQESFYQQLVDPLEGRGRHDLADVIREKLREFQRRSAWEEERDWKGAVKRFDRRVLGAVLYRSYSAMRNGEAMRRLRRALGDG